MSWGWLLTTSKSLMNPSDLRMPAMALLVFDAGIDTVEWSTAKAFLIRVNISAIGSVTTPIISALPTRLSDPGQLALQGQFSEADAAQAEIPYISPGSPTEVAPVSELRPVLGGLLPFGYLGCSGHATRFLPVTILCRPREGHPELGQ